MKSPYPERPIILKILFQTKYEEQLNPDNLIIIEITVQAIERVADTNSPHSTPSARSRRSVTSLAAGASSIPMNRRPSRAVSSRVVPLPA